MRRKISTDVWNQVDVAVAAGIGAREIARNMGLPEGTVLSHLKRKGISKQIRDVKAIIPAQQSGAITPLQSAAVTMQQRAERYTQRMAGVSESVLPHLESLPPNEILDNARNLEQFDRVARRNFGLDNQPVSGGALNLAVLTGQAAIQIVNNSA